MKTSQGLREIAQKQLYQNTTQIEYEKIDEKAIQIINKLITSQFEKTKYDIFDFLHIYEQKQNITFNEQIQLKTSDLLDVLCLNVKNLVEPQLIIILDQKKNELKKLQNFQLKEVQFQNQLLQQQIHDQFKDNMNYVEQLKKVNEFQFEQLSKDCKFGMYKPDFIDVDPQIGSNYNVPAGKFSEKYYKNLIDKMKKEFEKERADWRKKYEDMENNYKKRLLYMQGVIDKQQQEIDQLKKQLLDKDQIIAMMKEAYENQIQQLKSQIDQLLKENSDLKQQLKDKDDIIRQQAEYIKQLEQTIRNLRKLIEQLRREIEDLKRQLALYHNQQQNNTQNIDKSTSRSVLKTDTSLVQFQDKRKMSGLLVVQPANREDYQSNVQSIQLFQSSSRPQSGRRPQSASSNLQNNSHQLDLTPADLIK